MRATVHWSDGGMAVATCGPLYVTVLRQPSTAARLRRVRGEVKRMAARFPGKVLSLTVLEAPSFGTMAEDARAEASAMMKESTIAAAAIVMEGAGFKQATVRMLISGLLLVVKPRYPQRIFESVDAGGEWLLQIAAKAQDAPVSRSELVDTVEAARQALTQPPRAEIAV